jgi:NADP-dependent 3-hydroxy acid dehydrogenase YdfG
MGRLDGKVAIITGGARGQGAAEARLFAAEGARVVIGDVLDDVGTAVAEELGSQAAAYMHLDVTDEAQWDAAVVLTEERFGPVTVLVNNAGGAHGLDPIETASVDDWQWMYDVNVLGTLRVTQALLPDLDAGSGTVVMMSSTAGLIVYEGGAGYAAAKHAQTAMAETLRLELCGRPIRVIEIDPGMVKTDEFGLVRFGGDAQRAEAVYAGVAEPLVAEDIADCVAWVVTRPHHVNIDRLVVRPLAQAAQHKVHRVLP